MSPVATLVERSTLFLMLVASPGGNHKADAVANALAAAVTTLPDQLGCSPADRSRWLSRLGQAVVFIRQVWLTLRACQEIVTHISGSWKLRVSNQVTKGSPYAAHLGRPIEA